MDARLLRHAYVRGSPILTQARLRPGTQGLSSFWLPFEVASDAHVFLDGLGRWISVLVPTPPG